MSQYVWPIARDLPLTVPRIAVGMQDGHPHSMHTHVADLDDLGRKRNVELCFTRQLSAIRHRSNSGNPAVIELSSLRPVTLRPHLLKAAQN